MRASGMSIDAARIDWSLQPLSGPVLCPLCPCVAPGPVSLPLLFGRLNVSSLISGDLSAAARSLLFRLLAAGSAHRDGTGQ